MAERSVRPLFLLSKAVLPFVFLVSTFFFSLHEVFARLAILFFFFLASPILVRPRSPFGDVIRSLQLRKLGNSRARKKKTKGAKNERG